jgi:hypothetical protein
MGDHMYRAATALITLGGLALLLALMSGIAIVTKADPLISDDPGKTVVSQSLRR